MQDAACQPGIQCPTQGHFNLWRGCRIAHHKIHKQWCSYELLRSIYTASLGPHINLMISNYLERVLSYDLYRNSFFFNTTQIITRYPRSGSLSLLALYRNVLVELNKKIKMLTFILQIAHQIHPISLSLAAWLVLLEHLADPIYFTICQQLTRVWGKGFV